MDFPEVSDDELCMDSPNSPRRFHDGIDRRLDVREIITGENIAVAIEVLSSSQPQRKMDARVINIGKDGLLLMVPSYVAPGLLVKLYLSGSILTAKVRHCTSCFFEYRIGVQIEEISVKNSK